MIIDRRQRPDPTLARRPPKGATRSAAGWLAAGFLAVALLGLAHGTTQAVAIRTSDGLALPTPGPVASAVRSAAPGATTAPDAGTIPGAATRSPAAPAAPDDWLVLTLGLVAAAGFARGLWLLLPTRALPRSSYSGEAHQPHG